MELESEKFSPRWLPSPQPTKHCSSKRLYAADFAPVSSFDSRSIHILQRSAASQNKDSCHSKRMGKRPDHRRPFTCSLCNKKFRRFYNLRSHVRMCNDGTSKLLCGLEPHKMGSSSDASITAVVPGSLQPSYVQSGFPERDFLINTRLLDLARDMSKADSGNTLLESSANQTDSNEDKPFSQCPKRSTTFEEGSLRDVHIIDSSCIKKPPAKREGVTSKQERELGKRRLSKCGVENWNEVYKVLFPGEPLPCSLYIERPLSAELIEFRNHALLRGPTIGEEIVREHLPDALRKHQHEVQTFFSSAYPKVVARLIESWTSETVSTSQSPDHQQTISSPPGRKAPSRKAPGRPSNANGITTSVSSNSPSRWNSALGNSVIGDMPTGNSQQRRHTRAQELTCQQQSRSLEEQQYQQQEQQQHPQQQRPYHRQPNVPAATYETQDNFNPTFDMYSQPHVQTYIGNSSSTSQTWQPPPELVNQFYTPNMGQPFQTPSSPYDLDFLPSMPATDSETSYLASDCFFELGICDPMGQ